MQSVNEGFDWASAAIGAGIAGGIILLISWGGVTYRHRHAAQRARALTCSPHARPPTGALLQAATHRRALRPTPRFFARRGLSCVPG